MRCSNTLTTPFHRAVCSLWRAVNATVTPSQHLSKPVLGQIETAMTTTPELKFLSNSAASNTQKRPRGEVQVSRAEKRAANTMKQLNVAVAELTGAVDVLQNEDHGKSTTERRPVYPGQMERMLAQTGHRYHNAYKAQINLADPQNAEQARQINNLIEGLAEDPDVDLGRVVQLMQRGAPREEVLAELLQQASKKSPP